MVEQGVKPPVLIAKETIQGEHIYVQGRHLNRLLRPALQGLIVPDDQTMPLVSTDGLKNSVPDTVLHHLESNDGHQVRWDIYMRRLYGILPDEEGMTNVLRRALINTSNPEQLPILLSGLIRKGNENEEASHILPLTPENLFYLYNDARKTYQDKQLEVAVSVGILGTLDMENGYIGPDFSALRAERLGQRL